MDAGLIVLVLFLVAAGVAVYVASRKGRNPANPNVPLEPYKPEKPFNPIDKR